MVPNFLKITGSVLVRLISKKAVMVRFVGFLNLAEFGIGTQDRNSDSKFEIEFNLRIKIPNPNSDPEFGFRIPLNLKIRRTESNQNRFFSKLGGPEPNR